eukprot:scaffold10270_cov417-Chaetoceros_neogracile.AAC.16
MFVRRISSRARSKVKRKKGEEGKNEVALKEQRGGLICQDSIPFIGVNMTARHFFKYKKLSENLVNPHSGHYITNITHTRLRGATSLLCATARVTAEFSSLRIQPLALTVRSVSTSYGF